MVLLVDDQAIVGEAIRRALAGQEDVDFHFCSDASAAVSMAERIAPTVILQDILMPGADGLALVREYRARPATRNTPVIVLSSREEPTTKRDAFAAGANDYLVKIPDQIELLARVRYHSQAFINRQQRDEAFRALRQSQKELLEANFELQRLMNMDGMTTLNNRRRFDEYIAVEWQRAVRDQAPIALLLADVDEFKRYNDTYGHQAGDEALKRVAEAIRMCCGRPADSPARYGGEEFAIVLPNTDMRGAGRVAEKLRSMIQALKIAHGGSRVDTVLTVSVGATSCAPRQDTALIDFIHWTDQALYEAKSAGRNRVVVRQ
jgi:two-component system chemotaxis family response regulator WspR